MDFPQEIIKLLKKHTSLKELQLSLPPDPKLGDYAFPCFPLGKNPKDEAIKLKSRLKLPPFLSRIETVGPYLNFYLNKTLLAEQTLTRIKKEKENYGQGKNKRTIVIEYCGPNTNKPLHLGHLRNMSLGYSACQLLSFQGNKVHPVNIINDRGIHISQSMLAYQKWGNNKQPNKKGDHFVGDYYVLFAQKAKENPALNEEAQQLLLKWEKKDPSTRALWKKMNQWVLNGFQQTYQRFGIKFEKEYFESEYYEKGKQLALEGLKKGIFRKDTTQAIVAPLKKFNLPDKVVLRPDGTAVYMTQDLYLVKARYQDYHFDRLIYVVASEQNNHFQQLFKILELLQAPYAKNLHHLSYGLVHLPGGRMKSREGTVVDADDILDEVHRLAEQEVKKRYPTLSRKQIAQRAEFISLAALKFFMLKTDAARDITFNPEESLNFEGETGPYLQYTHARASSILRKAGKQTGKQTKKQTEKQTGKVNFSLLQEPLEQNLINLLSKFPEKAKEAAEQLKPHLLSHYLIELAQNFNEFYHQHQVISKDKELMNARLLLVHSTRQVLANGLSLLGIHPPQEM